MDLAAYRKLEGKSQEDCANEVGLSAKSKGYISALESGAVCATIRVALRIERWSGGVVPAEGLVSPEDAQLLRSRPKRPQASHVTAAP